MCDAWLLVNEFPFVQVTKCGPIKPYAKVGPKHSLMALEGKNNISIFQYNSITSVKMAYAAVKMNILQGLL